MKLTFNQWLLELKRQRINEVLSVFENNLTKSLKALNDAYFDNRIKQLN